MPDINEIQILLDLHGEPVNKGDICLSTCHGYYAYVNCHTNPRLYNLFKLMNIWGGATNTYTTRDLRCFHQFELDCADKAFFKSRTFKRICERCDVKFVILDNGADDARIAREFWDQMRK